MMAPVFEHKLSKPPTMLWIFTSWMKKFIGAGCQFFGWTPRRIGLGEMAPMTIRARQSFPNRVHRLHATIANELRAFPFMSPVIKFRAIFPDVLLNRVWTAQCGMVCSFHGRPPISSWVGVRTPILPNRHGLPPTSTAVTQP